MGALFAMKTVEVVLSTFLVAALPTTVFSLAPLLLIGGHNNVMDLYDVEPRCDRQPFGHLPEPLGSANRAAIFKRRIYTCGGQLECEGATDKCFRFSAWPNRGTCAYGMPSMNFGRFGHTLTGFGDYLVATGGSRGNVEGVTASVEIFSYSNGWTVANWTLVAPAYRHCAVPISYTELLVISGEGSSRMKITKYDVTNGETESLEPPTEEVFNPKQNEIRTGEVSYACSGSVNSRKYIYVTQNVNWKETRTRVWKYDITAASWERLPDLEASYTHQLIADHDLTVFDKNGTQVLKNGEWQRADIQPREIFDDGAVVHVPWK